MTNLFRTVGVVLALAGVLQRVRHRPATSSSNPTSC